MATTHEPGDEDAPPESGSGLSRRQFLPAAGGGLAALAVAGFVGYELHPGTQRAKPAPTPKATAKPAATASTTTLEKPFVSRPDLSPPTVTITQLASGTSEEATPRFIALANDYVIEGSTPWQQGLMLVDRLGRLVWFKPAADGQKPFDLKLQTYQGKPVLTWWEGVLVADFGSGKAQIADTTFTTIKTVSGANGLTTDLHEFAITSSGAGLATAYHETTADLTALKGAKQGRIITCHAQVLDLATGKATFDWNALEHVALQESYKPVPTGQDLFDFFHMNSLQMLSDGSLLVSARNTWTVYRVDGKTGKIIWRMGGKKSDFKIEAAARFAWQHHATMWTDTEMTVFDNSTTKQAPSRGLLLSVDESAMTVSLSQEFKAPTGFYAGTLGSVQLMPNGNVFVGWGTQPYFTEFASDGTQLMFGQLPLGTRSYRTFLVDLVGAPTEKPVIVAKSYAAGGYQIYVSWNGATEIDSWRIDAGPTAHALKPVGTSPWTGFETAIVVDAVGPNFQAVALDINGHELGSSEVV